MNRLLLLRTLKQQQRLISTRSNLLVPSISNSKVGKCLRSNSGQPFNFLPTRSIRTLLHDERDNFLAKSAWNAQDTEEIFIEEDYLEEEEETEFDETESRHPDPDRPLRHLIEPEEVVSVLEMEKARNIEVVECTDPQSPYRYLVIASPYNDRHGQALIEIVRRYFCKKYYFGKENPRKKIESNGWYALDFHNGVLHIMKETLRERYNLARVWSGEEDTEASQEDEIDAEMIPTPNEKSHGSSRTRATPIIKP